MVINGKSKIDDNITRFKDLTYGDIFCFIDKYRHDSIKIFMKCCYLAEDHLAVNLDSGVCTYCDDNEPVKILDATMEVKNRLT